jgi:hypothetical protein
MISGDYFYQKITRRNLALFGYLFSDIKVRRGEGASESFIRVPCAFASPHREHPAYASDPSYKPKENVRVRQRMPRMGFVLDNWTFDQNRKRNTMERIGHASEGLSINQYQKVPYDLNVTLTILVDQLDDLFQIVEQIIPWFDPKLVVSAKVNEDLNLADDITISLNSTDPTIVSDGSFEENKQIEATLSFTIRTFFYRRTMNSNVITSVDVDVLASMEALILEPNINGEEIRIVADE